MGVNGATCLTFTHPGRIADIAAMKPELLILSFGTNESHNRRYNVNLHYNQMDELVKLLRDSLPDVPILLTTPPGSYESFRQRRRKRTYAINPRTVTAAAPPAMIWWQGQANPLPQYRYPYNKEPPRPPEFRKALPAF